MRTLDIGLDVDNVLYPWATVFTRWVERRKGLAPGTLDDIPQSWSWYKHQWGMEQSEMMDHFGAGVQAGVIFRHGDPLPGSLSCARRLWDAGHRLHYVTDRELPGFPASEAKRVTEDWLGQHGFPVSSVTVTSDKASVKTDVFLDDGPHNIEALVATGHLYPVLWDLPHNRDLFPSPWRARSWAGFERMVHTIAHLRDIEAPAPARLARGNVAA